METRKILGVAASVLMLGACGTSAEKGTSEAVAPPPNMNDPGDVAAATNVQRDEYGTSTIYKGPNIAIKPQDHLFIRATKADAGSVSYQIYVSVNYTGVWRFYNWAYDADGSTLDLTLYSRNFADCTRNDCAHNEHMGVDVKREYLAQHVQSGLRFWLSGKAGKEAFFIPSGYIKAFLSLSNDLR